jgi:regulatory protein
MSEADTVSSTKRINKAIGYACRLLGMREYSQKSLRLKLTQKGYIDQEIEATVEFLLDNNWLSDLRFCEVYIRSKANRGQGLQRICFELKSKGITQEMINQVLVEEPVDWQKVCDETCERKAANSGSMLELKTQQKLERFLRYRGFTGEQIRSSIKAYLN